MPTDFADYEDLVSDVIDDVHGEQVRFVPMRDSQYTGRESDPGRQPEEVTGIVDINPVMAQATDKGQYDGYQVNIGADRVHVSVDEDAFELSRPKGGDTIELLERLASNGQPKRLTVKDPQADGLGRIVYICAWI